MADVPVSDFDAQLELIAANLKAGTATLLRGNRRHDDEAWTSFEAVTPTAFRSQSTLLLENFGDIHPFKDAPAPVFPYVRTLVVKNCDKNFVFYWVRSHVFPNATVVLTDSSCEGAPFAWGFPPHVALETRPGLFCAWAHT